MEKRGNFSPIIRRHTSWHSRSFRGIILVLLWGFIALVVLANLGFSLGWYNDSLVSLYLLFNLKIHGDNQLLLFIAALIVLTPIYCGWRWHRLSHHTGGRR
ncbi:hypothetical protein [Levilactobacillus spicheri]|uniref:Uncharacterized protein n=1 Tax=Levilactobacillus spicheri TaxID=216463 RepID=A0A0F3RRS0_9LACO|nr:hypothetical protein [Levilactobacillus spicheri]KJW12696.1 hypothetical protein VC81_07270 [Levilactobacillus spicheri]